MSVWASHLLAWTVTLTPVMIALAWMRWAKEENDGMKLCRPCSTRDPNQWWSGGAAMHCEGCGDPWSDRGDCEHSLLSSRHVKIHATWQTEDGDYDGGLGSRRTVDNWEAEERQHQDKTGGM